MKIEKITVRGTSDWNEDSLVINEPLHLYGVLDGATSLTPFRGTNQETPGYMASRLVSGYLESLPVDSLQEFTLADSVLKANEELREAMIGHGVNVDRKEDLWTTGLAIVRILPHAVEYVQAGDCMIMAVYKDGTIRTITRDQVDHIDQQMKTRWEEGIRDGLTTQSELRKLVEPTILYNKRTMNTTKGYAIVSGEPELADYLEYGRVNRIQLSELFIVTDGLFLPQEQGLHGTRKSGAGLMEAMVAQMRNQSLNGYTEWLLEQEEADSECQRFVRFKKSDDKTAIRIIF